MSGATALRFFRIALEDIILHMTALAMKDIATPNPPIGKAYRLSFNNTTLRVNAIKRMASILKQIRVDFLISSICFSDPASDSIFQ